MTERRQGPAEGKLPLPSPRSPQQLDDKILAYARGNAPERKFFRQPRWIAGLATASIVALALFITKPQRLEPDFRTPAPSLQENLPLDADRAEKAKRELAAPAATMKMSRSTGQAARMDKYKNLADESLPEQEIAADAMAEAVEADEERIHGATQPLELTLSAAELKKFTSEELHDKLQLYADMVKKGDEERARAAYQQLRKSCPDCALPDTLAQAFVTLLETEPAAPEIKK